MIAANPNVAKTHTCISPAVPPLNRPKVAVLSQLKVWFALQRKMSRWKINGAVAYTRIVSHVPMAIIAELKRERKQEFHLEFAVSFMLHYLPLKKTILETVRFPHPCHINRVLWRSYSLLRTTTSLQSNFFIYKLPLRLFRLPFSPHLYHQVTSSHIYICSKMKRSKTSRSLGSNNDEVQFSQNN